LAKKHTTEEFSGGKAVAEDKVSLLRQRLGQKAKQEPKFRFYALYDRIYRLDVLHEAWKRVRANRGSPGIDGISIDDIVKTPDGIEKLVSQLRSDLKAKVYKPQAVKRTYIPKPDGRLRPLGIPTIRDRVAQMAALLILEPIFEADFLDCSYGFRPGCNAHQALGEIRSYLKMGLQAVYDADLKGYFDSIPHDKLMACLRTRIADRAVLHLIKLWLSTPCVEPPDSPKGKPKVSRSKKGTPQGGVISPLLANLFLHFFDKHFHSAHGPGNWAKAKLVRYADDFVILARYLGDRITGYVEQLLEGRFGLEINREKTTVKNLRAQGTTLDFLGFTYRWDKHLFGGEQHYLNLFPSKKALAKERETLRKMTGTKMCHIPQPQLIENINRHLIGWRQYFNFGYPRMAFGKINCFVRRRLIGHVKRRSQRPFRPPEGVTYYKHFERMGLICL